MDKGEIKMEREIIIAKDLLKIKAVFFSPDEPFTWASGIKSPIYCDNCLILTAPEVRNNVEKLNPDGTRSKCEFKEENGVIYVKEVLNTLMPAVLFIS